MACADVVYEVQEPCHQPLTGESEPSMWAKLLALAATCEEHLRGEGFTPANISYEAYLNIRYEGTDCAMMTAPARSATAFSMDGLQRLQQRDFNSNFFENYKREFGFLLSGRALLADDLRVRAVAHSPVPARERLPVASEPLKPVSTAQVYWANGWQDTPVFHVNNILQGHRIAGPALLVEGVCEN